VHLVGGELSGRYPVRQDTYELASLHSATPAAHLTHAA